MAGQTSPNRAGGEPCPSPDVTDVPQSRFRHSLAAAVADIGNHRRHCGGNRDARGDSNGSRIRAGEKTACRNPCHRHRHGARRNARGSRRRQGVRHFGQPRSLPGRSACHEHLYPLRIFDLWRSVLRNPRGHHIRETPFDPRASDAGCQCTGADARLRNRSPRLSGGRRWRLGHPGQSAEATLVAAMAVGANLRWQYRRRHHRAAGRLPYPNRPVSAWP